MRTHARVSIFVHKRMFCSGTFPPALPSFLTARCSCGIISLRRPGRADALKHSLSIFSYLKGFYFIFTSRDGLARHRLLITSFSLRRVTSWRCRSSRRVSWSPPLCGVTPRGPRPPPAFAALPPRLRSWPPLRLGVAVFHVSSPHFRFTKLLGFAH